MKRVTRAWLHISLRPIFLAALFACLVQATPTLTINPSNGFISGGPGQTVGWGFTLFDDTLWLELVATDFCTSFGMGDSVPCTGKQVNTNGSFYTDYTGFETNGYTSPPGGPPDMSQMTFMTTEPTTPCMSGTCFGAGGFTIDPSVPVGTTISGVLVFDYFLFSADPNNPITCPTGCQVGGDNFVTTNVTVLVTPEPATFLFAGFALAGIGYVRRRRRRR